MEQVYAIWEEDTQGTKTFNGSIGTTLRVSDSNPPSTITGTIGFSLTVMTQDELILQRKISRNAYFAGARSDQGCGFALTDYTGTKYDNTFLTSGAYWPVYDCGVNWSFTWPYNNY